MGPAFLETKVYIKNNDKFIFNLEDLIIIQDQHIHEHNFIPLHYVYHIQDGTLYCWSAYTLICPLGEDMLSEPEKIRLFYKCICTFCTCKSLGTGKFEHRDPRDVTVTEHRGQRGHSDRGVPVPGHPDTGFIFVMNTRFWPPRQVFITIL